MVPEFSHDSKCTNTEDHTGGVFQMNYFEVKKEDEKK